MWIVLVSMVLGSVTVYRFYQAYALQIRALRTVYRETGVLGTLKMAGLYPDPPTYHVQKGGPHVIVEIPKMCMSVIYDPGNYLPNSPSIVGYRGSETILLTPPVGHPFDYSPAELRMESIHVRDFAGLDLEYLGNEKVVWPPEHESYSSDFED